MPIPVEELSDTDAVIANLSVTNEGLRRTNKELYSRLQEVLEYTRKISDICTASRSYLFQPYE